LTHFAHALCINVHCCNRQFLIQSSLFCKSQVTISTQHQLVKLH